MGSGIDSTSEGVAQVTGPAQVVGGEPEGSVEPPETVQDALDWDHPSSALLITGKRGTGKTTLWFERIGDGEDAQLFVFDPDLEFARRQGIDYCTTWEACAQCVKAGHPVVFDPVELYQGDLREGFGDFCEWCLSICRILPGKKKFCVDELQKWVPRSPAYVPHGFQLILDEGRRYSLDLCLISRRPNLVNEAVRAELTEVISFQQTDRNPLKWLEEDGFDPDEVKVLAKPGGFIAKDL